jgi:polysaccharide biosynthesis/export protein
MENLPLLGNARNAAPKKHFPPLQHSAALFRRLRMGRIALAAFLVVGTALWGWAQDTGPDSDTGSAAEAPAPAEPNVPATTSAVLTGPSYEIGPNDLLHISVWKEPDLTATVPVRSDGMISVPLLNDVLAAGLTPMQLSALLQQKLKKYVNAPQVTVVVTQTNSHRIYVVGEVLHAGPLSLSHDMTVLQALATAGFTQFANTKKVYILRTDNNGQAQKIPFNYRQVIKGESRAQNIILKPDDTIVVP